MRSFLKKHDLSLIARAHQVIYSMTCIFIVISPALSLSFSFFLVAFHILGFFFLGVTIHGFDISYIP